MSSSRISPPARGEAGFTLIELLVAMLAGTIVTGALFLILDISLQQSTRIRNETAAAEIAGTAMTRIVDELHTACYYTAIQPVLVHSTSTTLIFDSATGTQSAPTAAYRRRIEFTGSTLTEKAWHSTSSSSWPDFEFNESEKASSTRQLATDVSESAGAPAPKGIFRYFKYATATNEAGGGVSALELSNPLEGAGAQHELSTEEAIEVAAVEVKFTAAGSSATSNQLEHAIGLSNLVSLSFSAPRYESGIEATPCQ
jgi:prepilin-type N-terminal cleavage/methylation domain-containing protein